MPKAEQNGEVSKERLAKLSEEYLRTRNQQMRAKAAVAQMELERRRGLLIDKKWAFDSLAYLLVCFRQRALLSPWTIARRLVTLSLVDAANEYGISEAIREEI
jgi:hypothetical protein